VNVNECVQNPCGAGSCQDTDGSFECSCYKGYDVNSDTGLCENYNECSNPDACPNGQCFDLPGTYRCECNAGYENSDAFTCVDQDECAAGLCGANANCSNTEGSYSCQCHEGFQLSRQLSGKSGCVDMNECSVLPDVCGDNARCENTMGSFRCMCNDRYEMRDGTCQAVDECARNPCAENENCINQGGSYKCTCKPGFGRVPGGICEKLTVDPVKEPFVNCTTAREKALSVNALGRIVPECDAEGQYTAVQTHASTGFSWCVDPKTGKKFDGSEIRGRTADCRRYLRGCFEQTGDRRFRAEGERFVSSYDPCETCECGDDGQISCVTLDCQKPTCDNFVRVKGTCCDYTCPAPVTDAPLTTTGGVCDGDTTCQYQCTEVNGAKKCVCPAGYEERDNECRDINECEVTPNICKSRNDGTECFNTLGGHQCLKLTCPAKFYRKQNRRECRRVRCRTRECRAVLERMIRYKPVSFLKTIKANTEISVLSLNFGKRYRIEFALENADDFNGLFAVKKVNDFKGKLHNTRLITGPQVVKNIRIVASVYRKAGGKNVIGRFVQIVDLFVSEHDFGKYDGYRSRPF